MSSKKPAQTNIEQLEILNARRKVINSLKKVPEEEKALSLGKDKVRKYMEENNISCIDLGPDAPKDGRYIRLNEVPRSLSSARQVRESLGKLTFTPDDIARVLS